jgi:hypothetical protein
MSQPGPVYVLECYCAKRILALIEQLHATIEEMLDRRIVEAPDAMGDVEGLDLDALIANTRAEEKDELF